MTSANVGPNPALAATRRRLTQNSAVVSALTGAAAQLNTKLSGVHRRPQRRRLFRAPGAAVVGPNAHSEQQCAGCGARESVRHRAATPGQAYVPLAANQVGNGDQSADQNARVAASGFPRKRPSTSAKACSAPQQPSALHDLDGIFRAVGRDTLQSTDRASIGDISVGATLNLLNSFGDTTGTSFVHPQYRLSVERNVPHRHRPAGESESRVRHRNRLRPERHRGRRCRRSSLRQSPLGERHRVVHRPTWHDRRVARAEREQHHLSARSSLHRDVIPPGTSRS